MGRTLKFMLGTPRPFSGFDIGRDGPTGSEGGRSRRTILFGCRGGSRGRVRYFLSLPISAVFSISFMFFGSPEG